LRRISSSSTPRAPSWTSCVAASGSSPPSAHWRSRSSSTRSTAASRCSATSTASCATAVSSSGGSATSSTTGLPVALRRPAPKTASTSIRSRWCSGRAAASFSGGTHSTSAARSRRAKTGGTGRPRCATPAWRGCWVLTISRRARCLAFRGRCPMSYPKSEPSAGFDRRRFLALASALGAAAVPGILSADDRPGNQSTAIDAKILAEAEKLTGLSFTDAKREMMLKGLADQREAYVKLRAVHLDNSVPPALRFDPVPPGLQGTAFDGPSSFTLSAAPVPAQPDASHLEEIAFLPVTALAALVRERKVRSVDLTRMYLARLRRLDPVLHAVISFTEERALAAAEAADREIAAGHYRGPLHGIPWGAKDLLAARGARTTWGSVPFKDQVFDEDATVVARLEKAGAVLVARLALGELAWGDVWFDAMTRNPWNPEQGSSGSSAGSASATAAGAVGFAVGSETLGS